MPFLSACVADDGESPAPSDHAPLNLDLVAPLPAGPDSRAVLDLIPQMIWSTLPNGHHDYFSRPWYDYTGVPASSTDGEAWTEVFHPDDRERALARWRRSLATGEPYEVDYRLRHRSGDYRWVLGRARAQRDAAGRIVRWYGTCTDIHEQVVVEQRLARSEERFRTILDCLPGMVWSTRADGVQDYANEQWEQFAGVPLAKLERSGWLDLVHPDDLAGLEEKWTRSLNTGEAYEATFRFRYRTGQYRWVCSGGTPQRDESGEIVRWYGACVDVHERVIAENELKASQALNSSILDSSPDCIKLLEADGTILYLNPLGPKALEIEDAKGLLGSCWFDLLPHDVSAQARDAVAAAISGEDRQFVARVPTATGRLKWFDILVTPVRTGGEVDRVVVVARDITTQKASEDALREKETLYRSVLETSDDCITITDLDGMIELVNPPGLRALEVDDLAQVHRRNALSLWPAAAHPLLRAALAAARAGRSTRFTEACPTAKGTEKWWDVAVTPMRDEEGGVHRVLAIARDITANREATDRLRWTSEHDGLTSLPNRKTFQAHLQAATIRAMESGRMLGLLLLDLDHFKHVNDTLGHAAGDHLLKTFAQRLKASVRAGDVVARLGGDEFAVILEGVGDETDLVRAGESILTRLQAPVRMEGRALSAGASIGGALFPRDAATAHELFNNADTALYALKAAGRGGTRMFHNHMREQAQKVASQLSLARVALTERSVLPHYQPKIDLRTGAVAGYEALLRWRHPLQGIQLPDTVQEAFNDYELASRIGELMQNKVLEDIRRWQDAGLAAGPISINAAPAEFLRDDYAERLLKLIAQAGISPATIEVEVTEHVFIDRGSDFVARALKMLNQAGVRIALDDFGTGYSSLSHLRDFPVDVVKIDHSFTRKMIEEPEISAIVTAVIDLALSLGIDVVAEGVETEEQRAVLAARGCTFGQGYLFGKAVPADETERLFRPGRAAA